MMRATLMALASRYLAGGRRYGRADVVADLMAGLTVGIMLVPQGMAYAMLAGLPPVVGLYASVIPALLYAVLGTSRFLAVGPVAIVSLLTAGSIGALAPGAPPEVAVALAASLALLVGLLQLAMGLLRLGMLANFMSHAVMQGFTSAAAIVIALSQLKHLLDVKLPEDKPAVQLVASAVGQIGHVNIAPLLLGGLALALLLLGKRYLPKAPMPLLVVAGATLLVLFLRLDVSSGVKIVAAVPAGLPAPRIPSIAMGQVAAMLPTVFIIAFIGFMESISIAKVLAARERDKVDVDRELVSMGLANLGSACAGAYPVTGSFSRSAVLYGTGARSRLAGLVAALVVALALVALTPLFYYLPKAVLAAIVMAAVIGLLNLRELRRLFHLRSDDGWAFLLTFAGILALGVEHGILIGIGWSLAAFMWRSARPHVAELGYDAATQTFRDRTLCPEASTFPGVLILRIDSRLYFANAAFVEQRVRAILADRRDVTALVFELAGVNDMDSGALHMLEELAEEYHALGIRFYFSHMKSGIRLLAERAGWDARAHLHWGYPTVCAVLDELGVALPATASLAAADGAVPTATATGAGDTCL